MQPTFTFRLNLLFATVHPPGRGPFSGAEAVAALRRRGHTMSAPYLSQLRSGNRTAPSEAVIGALADVFRVSRHYFTDECYFHRVDEELVARAGFRDEAVRDIVMRSVGLSPEAQQQIIQRAEELRRKEHLDDLFIGRLTRPTPQPCHRIGSSVSSAPKSTVHVGIPERDGPSRRRQSVRA